MLLLPLLASLAPGPHPHTGGIAARGGSSRSGEGARKRDVKVRIGFLPSVDTGSGNLVAGLRENGARKADF